MKECLPSVVCAFEFLFFFFPLYETIGASIENLENRTIQASAVERGRPAFIREMKLRPLPLLLNYSSLSRLSFIETQSHDRYQTWPRTIGHFRLASSNTKTEAPNNRGNCQSH